VAFTDGRQIGATLDRNRPAPGRFVITDQDNVIMASEPASLSPESDRSQVAPAAWQMLLIDMEEGRIIEDGIKRSLAEQHADLAG